MLKATTEEQRLHIEEILAPYHIYISWSLDWETDASIYIDGTISFDVMAEIVEYLKSQNK